MEGKEQEGKTEDYSSKAAVADTSTSTSVSSDADVLISEFIRFTTKNPFWKRAIEKFYTTHAQGKAYNIFLRTFYF